MADHVLALDQGTTSTRAIVFDSAGEITAVAQREHAQIMPRAGWVEHDPVEIWTNTEWVIAAALQNAQPRRRRHRRRRHHEPARDGDRLGPPQRAPDLQRDRVAGHPHAAADQTRSRRRAPAPTASPQQTGLPLATYFSASKVAWILENVPGARAAAEAGDALFGTPDTWLAWNLTGGSGGGIHVTDVTNASRTQLFDLATLDWSDELLGGVRHPAPDDARGALVVRGDGRRAWCPACCAACRSPASSATSRRRRSGRRRSRRANRRTPTAPATSCS